MNYSEQIVLESINKEKEDLEKLRKKIFILENIIIKKESIITGLRKKLEKYNNESEEFRFPHIQEREIIIIEPSMALNQIHDELFLYKQVYENLSSHLKILRTNTQKYEKVIQVLLFL